MTKLTMVLFSVLLLTQVTMAKASNEIQDVINTYQYQVEVQDIDTELAARELNSKIKKFSKEEILSYLEVSMIDSSVKADFNNLVSILNSGKDMSGADVKALMDAFIGDTVAQGSSWAGSSAGNIVLLTLLVVLVIATSPFYFDNTGYCYWDNFYYCY